MPVDRLEVLRSFVAVYAEGSFSEAARKLGLPRGRVSKQLAWLEADLGVQLFHRTTRRVTATEAGVAFAERCSRILAELTEAEQDVRQLQRDVQGVLRVSAPMSFGLHHVAPMVMAYARQYPKVLVDLALNDRLVDLLEEGFDVGIRIGRMSEGSFIMRTVGHSRRLLCASPRYLAEAGTPAAPADLADHACLHYGYLASGCVWPLGRDGKDLVTVRPRLSANNGDILRDAAVAGLGIAFLPTFIIGDALRNGAVVAVLNRFEPPPLPVAVVYPPGRRVPAKVRTFVDLVTTHIGHDPNWERDLPAAVPLR